MDLLGSPIAMDLSTRSGMQGSAGPDPERQGPGGGNVGAMDLNPSQTELAWNPWYAILAIWEWHRGPFHLPLAGVWLQDPTPPLPSSYMPGLGPKALCHPQLARIRV